MRSDQWKADRDQKRAEREARQFARRMASPVARGEVAQYGELQLQHIASLALAIEALEDLLVGAGVLDIDELLDTMKLISAHKMDIALAAQAASDKEN
jgi:hypothetical protein